MEDAIYIVLYILSACNITKLCKEIVDMDFKKLTELMGRSRRRGRSGNDERSDG
jgi:hypothetical protein